MRIRNINVKKAGPLSDFSAEFGQVNFISGDNENGKTTLVDLMIRDLFTAPGNRKTFTRSFWSDRFSEAKYHVDMEGEEFKETEIPAASLLVIRQGDNRWTGRSELHHHDPRFWNEDVKTLLYGNDLIYPKIHQDLKRLLGVSTKRSYLNIFAENLNKLEQSAREQSLKLDLLKNNHDTMVRYRKELEQIESELEEQSLYRQAEADDRARKLGKEFFSLISRLKEMDQEIHDLMKAQPDDIKESWKDLRTEKENSIRSADRLELELKNNSGLRSEKTREMESLRDELKELKEQLRRKEEMKASLLESVAREEKNAEWKLEQLKETRQSPPPPVVTWVLGFMLLLMGGLSFLFGLFNYSNRLNGEGIAELSLIGVEFSVSADMLVLAMIAGSVALIIGLLLLIFYLSRRRRHLTVDSGFVEMQREIRIRLDAYKREKAGRLEMIEESIDGYYRRGRDIEDKVGKIQAFLNPEEDNRKLAHLKELREKIARMKEQELEWMSLFGSYEKLISGSEKLRLLTEERERMCNRFEEIKNKIREVFGTDEPSRIHEELKHISGESGEGLPEGYSEEQFQILAEQKDDLNREIGQLVAENEKLRGEISVAITEALSQLSANIAEEPIQRFYPDLHELSLHGDVYNLTGLLTRIQDWKERIERDIRLSQTVAKAFDTVESGADELLDRVIKNEHFSAILSKLTAGIYTCAAYELDNKGNIDFRLERSDGTNFPFDSLSTGVKNQFYLAVRLALLESTDLFREEPGLLILDDAFLSFDQSRRKSAVKLLKDYADKGWQIFYSSVNEKSMEQTFSDEFGKNLILIRLNEGSDE